jgi:hypothetical protein
MSLRSNDHPLKSSIVWPLAVAGPGGGDGLETAETSRRRNYHRACRNGSQSCYSVSRVVLPYGVCGLPVAEQPFQRLDPNVAVAVPKLGKR